MVKRNSRNRVEKQLKAILKETDNPAILTDVTDTEFGVMPGFSPETLTAAEKYSVKNSTDGKTWNSADDR
ncbi:hypothetical protein [Bacillus sp. AK031]